MQIRKFKDVAHEALEEIRQFQSGEKRIIKTGRPYLDDIFPVVNGTVITISAPSSVGKSFELMRVMNNIMDTSLNPTATNFVSLNITLEMKTFNLVLRDLNKRLRKTKVGIVTEEFSPEELALVEEYKKYISDDRQYISQDPTTPSKFYNACRQFILDNQDKESIIIGYDHLALTGADKGEGKNSTIEAVIEKVNDLKMEFKNVIFILVSQTNSDIQKRAKEKDRTSQPIQSDLYYSGFTFQISDYVVVLVNPFKLGIAEYSKLQTEHYPQLKDYFLEEDKNGRASLETYGVVYYHLLKCRESEDGQFPDIYAEDLNFGDVQKVRQQRKKEKQGTFGDLFGSADVDPLEALKQAEYAKNLDVMKQPLQQLDNIFDL